MPIRLYIVYGYKSIRTEVSSSFRNHSEPKYFKAIQNLKPLLL